MRWFLNSVALVIVSYLIPGISFSSIWALVFASLILGFLNAIIRPLLLILTLPVNILSIGFFTLIINALIFWLASSIVRGFEVADFTSAFWGALIYYLIIMIINNFFDSNKVKVIKP